MIDHTGVQVSDPKQARAFHEAALAPLGYGVLREIPAQYTGGRVVFGMGVAPKPDFWVAEGKPNEPRVHIAFYAAAMGAGGRDNGPPGPRPHYHESYYGAFARPNRMRS